VNFYELPQTEQDYFTRTHGVTSTKHTALIYAWFQSIIKREAKYMIECEQGEISDATGYQWSIDFDTDDQTIAMNEDWPEYTGYYVIKGTLSIFSADPATDVPTHEYLFNYKYEL